MCKEGFYNLCPEMEFFATPPVHGSLANYVRMLFSPNTHTHTHTHTHIYIYICIFIFFCIIRGGLLIRMFFLCMQPGFASS
jgi:hypothetical protein